MNEFFKNMGFISSGILHLSPKESFELCKNGAILVDLREEYLTRFKMFDIDETIFCPYAMLKEKYKGLIKDKALIFADSTGIHSKDAVSFLKNKSFNNIANMAGGLVEWERNSLPIKVDLKEQLSGSCACMLRKREKKWEKG